MKVYTRNCELNTSSFQKSIHFVTFSKPKPLGGYYENLGKTMCEVNGILSVTEYYNSGDGRKKRRFPCFVCPWSSLCEQKEYNITEPMFLFKEELC